MFIVVAIIIGLLPAYIAHTKGRNFFVWWLYGAAIWIVAFPHSLLLKSDQKALDEQAMRDGLKRCPACAELIREEARICRYCHHDQAMA